MTGGAQARIDPEKAARLMRMATYASVGTACFLIAVKFAAWLLTDSVSLLSTLIDSLVDAGASLINLIAVRHSLQPADREHRFGHGKAEPLAGLAQAAFITGSAGFLLVEAVSRLAHPRAVANSEIGMIVMVLAIVLTLGLVVFQDRVVRKTGSVAIGADSLHYKTDILVNASVILALILARELGWRFADPIFAIGISAYILHSAWKIGMTAFNLLMDHELPPEDRDRITAIACNHAGVVGVHDMRTRSSGPRLFVEIHLELDGSLSLWDAHAITLEVLALIQEAYPNAEVIIHQDPAGVVEPRLNID